MSSNNQTALYSGDLLINSSDSFNRKGNSEVQSDTVVILIDAAFEGTNADLLNKILGAVGLNEADWTLANLSSDKRYALSELLSAKVSRVIIFGNPSEVFGSNIQWIPFLDVALESVTALCAPSLAELEQSPEAKKKLWSALKSLFNVS